MAIDRFIVTDFRNISFADLNFSPKFNLIYGKNGSGKTSLLEAIYYLGHNRSFRSHLKQRIVQHGKDKLILFAEMNDKKLGLERSLNLKSQIHLDEETIHSILPITEMLPIQVIDSKTFQLLDSVPENRRQFLDWGVFHMEHQYSSLWKKFQRILKQRNHALRARLPIKEVKTWDEPFVIVANEINALRKAYFNDISEYFAMNNALFDFGNIDYQYKQGWNADFSLEEHLKKNISSDMRFGYTQCGPQRADIKISFNAVPAKDVLSRGQQKFLISCMKTSQLQYLFDRTSKRALLLLDDLPSELDNSRQMALVSRLKEVSGQMFITSIDKASVYDCLEEKSSTFHVEHGTVVSES